MSLWIDVKYAGLVSTQLDCFKVKNQNPYLANFRCPICGDSEKNPNKARGYFYTKGNVIHYKCHNCQAALNISSFIKQINGNLYNAYRLEKYREGRDMDNHSRHVATKPEFIFSPPQFEEETLLDKLLDRIDRLPETHIAVQYLKYRCIPREKYKKLYFIPNVGDIEQLSEKYRGKIKGEEPRIVIPIRNADGKLIGVSCRAIDGNLQLKYLTIKIVEDVPYIYNIENINKDQPIYCVEGPLDSMFLENVVAAGNSNFKAVYKNLSNCTIISIYDNQPRNKEICKLMHGTVHRGGPMVIWPKTIVEKDINEMVMAGKSVSEVRQIIKTNTFEGLELANAFRAWKKA